MKNVGLVTLVGVRAVRARPSFDRSYMVGDSWFTTRYKTAAVGLLSGTEREGVCIR